MSLPLPPDVMDSACAVSYPSAPCLCAVLLWPKGESCSSFGEAPPRGHHLHTGTYNTRPTHNTHREETCGPQTRQSGSLSLFILPCLSVSLWWIFVVICLIPLSLSICAPLSVSLVCLTNMCLYGCCPRLCVSLSMMCVSVGALAS